MIDTVKIMDALTKLVSVGVPEFKEIYVDLVPSKFKRPSVLVESITTSPVDAACQLINETAYFTLTVFDATDSYDRSSNMNLLSLQTQVLKLFRKGYLEVEDETPECEKIVRCLHIAASTGGRNTAEAYIDLQLEYYEDRDDTPDTTPTIEEVDLNMRVKE